MTDTREPATKDSRIPSFGLRALHIFTLCSFALMQPILVALAGQTVYLHDQQVGWLQIAVLLAILMLVLPIGFLAADQVIFRLTRPFHGRGRNTVFAVLIVTIMMSLLRPYLAIPWMETSASGGLIALAATIPCSCVIAYLYERSPGLRSWFTFASIGLVIFPGMFLWQFNTILKVETTIDAGTVVKNPVPVILVVFDEFAGMTLLNERSEIDERRFPHFARLGRSSTWYRNATTVHPRTQIAVPAILSGRFPKTELSPLAAQYPDNLIQLIESTKKFDLAVFEPATRLCPLVVRSESPPIRDSWEKCVDLVQTLSAVYPRLIFSKDAPIGFPTIPRAWFGLSRNPFDDNENSWKPTEGRFNYLGTENRNEQFEHFLKCLHASERPRFGFYHTVLPHYPWCFLPTGEQYQFASCASQFPSGASGELGEDWRADPAIILRNEYRYRLQVGYVDTLIGRLLDRLEATGLLDRCLLVVTADHGVSFRPGHSRRLPDDENLADIMSVPLFIKFPGQTEGRIDDRNIESIDIFPTIAEVSGIEIPAPIDGISVSVEQRRPRKTLYFEKALTVVEPDFPQRLSAVKRQSALFGTGELDRPPVGTVSHPDWLGRRVSSFSVDNQTMRVLLGEPLKPPSWQFHRVKGTYKNCFVTGWLESSELHGAQGDIVVAIDGVIVDTGKTFPSSRAYQGFEFLLPKPFVIENPDRLELYLVDQTEQGVRFRRLTKELAPERLNRDN